MDGKDVRDIGQGWYAEKWRDENHWTLRNSSRHEIPVRFDNLAQIRQFLRTRDEWRGQRGHPSVA